MCAIKHTAIFKEDLCGCFCEWRSGINLSKILATMKHYKKKLSWWSNFKKIYFPLFWFSLKQILGSERKCLSHYQLFLFHDVQIFLFAAKNENWNYRSKTPASFLIFWLGLTVLKELWRILKLLKLNIFGRYLFNPSKKFLTFSAASGTN